LVPAETCTFIVKESCLLVKFTAHQSQNNTRVSRQCLRQTHTDKIYVLHYIMHENED